MSQQMTALQRLALLLILSLSASFPCVSSFTPYKLCELGSETANLAQDSSSEKWYIAAYPTNSSVLAKACWCVSSGAQSQSQYYPFYCPVQFDTCRVDEGTWKVTCLELNNDDDQASSAQQVESAARPGDWVVPFLAPFVVLLYIGLSMALVCSRKGNIARDYMCIHCRLLFGSCWRSIWYCCCYLRRRRRNTNNNNAESSATASADESSSSWDDRRQVLVQQSLTRTTRQYGGWMRLLLHDGVARERAELRARGEADPTLAPTHLELRTKIYYKEEDDDEQVNNVMPTVDDDDDNDVEAAIIQTQNDDDNVGHRDSTTETGISNEHHDDDNDEDSDVICAICMSEVEHGDRVGNLPCRHLFHVDCLKQWLRKKNECPMCSAKDVATRRAV